MLKLFTSPTPNGWKISIMIEELRELGYPLSDLIVSIVDLSAGEQFSLEYEKINPNQRIPALVADGITIIESCAILQYLGEICPSSLLPMNRRWEIIPWLYWQAANLGPAFGNKLSYTRYITAPEDAKAHPLERFGQESLRLVAVLDRRLEQSPYICGTEFTVVDIATFPWIRAYKWAKIDIERWPRVVAWLARCRARPGVTRGIAYGTPTEELDSFTPVRRDQYRKAGAKIANN